jgi:hypothetical protein
MKIKCIRCFNRGTITEISKYGELCQKCLGNEGDIDSEREMQRERDFDRIQQSIETGGDE